MKRTHGLDEREVELVKLLMADCRTHKLSLEEIALSSKRKRQ